MANLRPLALLLAVLGCALCRHADATAFEVGGDDGWVVPSASDGGRYNQWASKNRFLVGDIVHFKYKEDSVMVVTEADYDSCRASHPIFFSNNGDTEVELDHPGPIYFISGDTGHCERGQRMVVRVVGPGAPPPAPPSPPAPTGAAAPAGTTGGALAGAIAAVAMALPVVVIGV
ncbi:early nodulin-like protein 21 [Miscanthus floridulus]|uniref:early nodulin-like protein 21 n=1 Tax=Miscanthus floridulus TaxID=154761 RepID=UPI00345AB076